MTSSDLHWMIVMSLMPGFCLSVALICATRLAAARHDRNFMALFADPVPGLQQGLLCGTGLSSFLPLYALEGLCQDTMTN